MILDRFKQDPDEIKVKTIDYSEWLQTGEVLSGVSSSVSPTTVPAFMASAVNGTTDVSLTTSGGVADTVYTVEITANTSLGQTKVDCIEFILEEAC